MTITSAPSAGREVGRPRRRRKAALTVLIWLFILPFLVWAVIRLGGWERGPVIQLFAFTPYVAAAAWAPVILALATRRWTVAAVAVVVAILLAAAVLPRAIPSRDKGPALGVQLNVMTSNMLFGGADAAQIVKLVSERNIDVLAVQEFTTEGKEALAAAGLGALLPYSSLADEPKADGSGLYSRHPITSPGARRNGGGFMQAYATVQVPGAGPVVVESAHPLAPHSRPVLGQWRADVLAQPRADAGGTPRILLGDFNATLDHAPLRELISHGYRDAADATGKGLIGTWGPYDGDPIPPVTIDHVLVDERIGVREVSVHPITKSDHRAIIAGLTVPATS
ncbi:endonuclease/exonuclease/phosphatase family protein [Actinoplanes sp. TRM 88003]|uniref:Endonuclease/exonuclease/phosphatase family protein n=1 Tax=Paractinoplanes aksuensis TaxID=2939490 RepID=A0ABT1DME8_9ACTN|nr:endonuclease/exonuclease/phosphatase family protein [Actinoplanes aksuensis]MCO8272012.1 endonuclease/exonuclease/phosphatase family protein [Actinoplanes aksuensis]